MTDIVPQAASTAVSQGRQCTLRVAVDQHIRQLQNGYFLDHAHAVQALARLRRGIGRPATELPDLWGLVGVEQYYASGPGARRPIEEALRAESAAHIAVTLWALHQQSNRSKRMHVDGGPSVGTAVRRLMSGNPDRDEPFRKRLVRAGTATNLDVLTQRLREIVVLLRKAEIPLDYGLLAEQLDQWQRSGGPSDVRRAWGRSFHGYRPAKSSGENEDAAGQVDTTTHEMKEDE
ncbi:type I-E CRISPR-associated protein Cse2/CasB [Streptomyces sp. URMC 127]|uniref:type I-E CRISPR-associated protein Cse2/CasB n=1 Tax=Streptomyces sp. URMC 127 TaxID=3423402 RepID=UPI003F1DBCE9